MSGVPRSAAADRPCPRPMTCTSQSSKGDHQPREGRKIDSPRRQPWVAGATDPASPGRGERTTRPAPRPTRGRSSMMFCRPCRGFALRSDTLSRSLQAADRHRTNVAAGASAGRFSQLPRRPTRGSAATELSPRLGFDDDDAVASSQERTRVTGSSSASAADDGHFHRRVRLRRTSPTPPAGMFHKTMPLADDPEPCYTDKRRKFRVSYGSS